jgi:DNA-binding NtrC family response regulator
MENQPAVRAEPALVGIPFNPRRLDFVPRRILQGRDPETRQFRRLGGERLITSDVRIITATNKNLEQEVRRGNFRQDLFYRLNVVQIVMPPLRDRKDDIPLLVEYLVSTKLGGRMKKRLTPAAMDALMQYEWPGNVRELANVIERALIVAAGHEVQPVDLSIASPGEGTALPALHNGLDAALQEFEKQTLLKALEICGDSRTEAAKLLKLTRSKFYRKLTRYNIATHN